MFQKPQNNEEKYINFFFKFFSDKFAALFGGSDPIFIGLSGLYWRFKIATILAFFISPKYCLLDTFNLDVVFWNMIFQNLITFFFIGEIEKHLSQSCHDNLLLKSSLSKEPLHYLSTHISLDMPCNLAHNS